MDTSCYYHATIHKRIFTKMQATLFDLPSENNNQSEYQALARKYRPTKFSDMIGQPVLVKTMQHAIAQERIPQAIILTGIRGVGKTTTARIIAKAINCLNMDIHQTQDPCGVCDNCLSITEGRNQDILEMDAASHTGVSDIREIIESARYKPIAARYKVYIIDEVHMLSNSAFNALLKTLEEPPPHVKFIFATTEVRKIPLTILSRCQRFDLKRIDNLELMQYYHQVLTKEGFTVEDGALKLIANAAQGSVRDGLSILDQSLARDNKHVTENSVRTMLGLADQSLVFSLFENIITGNVKNLLADANNLFSIGADPQLIVQDLLEMAHHITRIKSVNFANIFNMPELEWETYSNLATKLDMIFLSRLWQMLIKGLEEMKTSIYPFSAFEMMLLRIAHASQLPSIEEILNDSDNFSLTNKTSAPKKANFKEFSELVTFMLNNKEYMLYHHLTCDIGAIEFSPGHLKIKLYESAPKNLPLTLKNKLKELLNEEWMIIAAEDQEVLAPTLAQLNVQKEQQRKVEIADSELVKEVLNTFTGSKIADITINNTI